MTNCLLNNDLIEHTIGAGLGPAERENLVSHLDSDCAGCEEFLADLPDRYADLILDGTLARLAEQDQSFTLDPGARARIFERTGAVQVAERHPRPASFSMPMRRSWRTMAFATAYVLVTSLAIVYLSFFHHGLGEGPITKGPTGVNDSGVLLQFLVVEDDGGSAGEPRIKRGVNHGAYPASAWLAFRFEVTRPCHAYIAHVDSAGAAELAYPGEGEDGRLSRSGVYDANQGGRVLLYPLKDLDGIQTFCVAVFEDGPPAEEEVLQKVASIVDVNRESSSGSRIRYKEMDCFEIKVEGTW